MKSVLGAEFNRTMYSLNIAYKTFFFLTKIGTLFSCFGIKVPFFDFEGPFSFFDLVTVSR